VKKVAIIGAGFTGLVCARDLAKKGYKVDIFESGVSLGGLAGSFRGKNWKQSLEKYYHHIFTNDKEIRDLADEIEAPYVDYDLVTASFVDGQTYRLDSPVSLLKFSPLPIWQRLWMGMGLALLKIIKNGQWLERWQVVDVLPNLVSRGGYEKIWRRLLSAKFGKYLSQVNMAWFWSRVTKRTQKLGYFEGGFERLLMKLAESVRNSGGVIHMDSEVKSVNKTDSSWIIDGKEYDSVVVTTPAPVAEKITKGKVKFARLDYLWGQTLILTATRDIGESYWLNILEEKYPFLVVVNQTRLVPDDKYNNHKVIYLGNYLAGDDKRLEMNKDELLDLYMPFIKKIDPKFGKKDVIESHLFKSPFAQPVFPIHYSKLIPKMDQGDGMWIANMSMVYPHDRGTNYAVKMGSDVAHLVDKYLEP
jgi:protoporphyrinogen oxidase